MKLSFDIKRAAKYTSRKLTKMASSAAPHRLKMRCYKRHRMQGFPCDTLSNKLFSYRNSTTRRFWIVLLSDINAGKMSDTLEKNVVMPNGTPFRIISEENLHQYQGQVNLHCNWLQQKSWFGLICTDYSVVIKFDTSGEPWSNILMQRWPAIVWTTDLRLIRFLVQKGEKDGRLRW